MGSMKDEDIERMKNMSQQQFGQNRGGAAPQQQPNPGFGSESSQWVPNSNSQQQKPASTIKNKDIEEANRLKERANNLFKEQQFEKACEKYYESINSIRFNETIKNNPEARQIEIACRLNVALCKDKLGEHNVVIDQCQQVLEYEPKNWKACFRLSNAMYLQNKGKQNIKAIHDYAKIALDGNPSDQKIKDFYTQVKSRYQEYQDSLKEDEEKKRFEELQQKKQQEEQQENQNKQQSKQERVVEEEKVLTPNQNQQQQQKFVAPNPLQNLPEEEKERILKQGTEQLKNMDDSQLNTMVNMMKNNKDYVKQMYKAQGMDLSDAQIEQMSSMMNPEMIKMARDMMSSNPDLINQMKSMQGNRQQPPPMNNQASQQIETNQNKKQPQNSEEPIIEEEVKSQPAQQQQPQFNPFEMMNQMNQPGGNNGMMDMMSNMMNNPMVQQMMQNPDMMRQAQQMMSGGNMDPSKMQDMMQNPSMKNLMSNPDMISNALNMMKDPRNKGMLDMMKQQNPNLNVDMMMKAIDVLAKVASTYKRVKSAWANIYVRLTVFALLVAIIAYFWG
ncbi:tpr domain containing protein [Stylonychia lemnae]|uniref:Tpr domain containing protein n=1 Tax=Stylonychia lemnae TaxID=5949 RepID=A0A078B324_STYLE|nr:tpr domain containing protein [Stylonychia lemnae]|eukprot:CDW87647.1 tpr domain containing protein [Stylonychia lemnae]